MTIRLKRRTAYAILVAGMLVTCAYWHAANASPTQGQVRRAVAPAFRQRQLSLGVLTVAAALDVLTTEQALHRGCHEANPIYGRHPSLGELVGAHALVVGVAWYGRTPVWANYGAAALFGIVAAHNASLRCAQE